MYYLFIILRATFLPVNICKPNVTIANAPLPIIFKIL